MLLPHASITRDMALLALLGMGSLAVAAQTAGRVDGARIVSVAQAALMQQLQPHSTRIELSPRHTPDNVAVPHGELGLRVETHTLEWAPSIRMVVAVDVDGRLVRRVPVWFSVAAYAPGLVAAQDLPSGHRLVAANLQQAVVNLSRSGQRSTDTPDALLGKRLRHSVAKGRPLFARDAETPPAVARGERIVVELNQAGIAITAPGVAMADARIGERVEVRMRQADVLAATVVGPQRARLHTSETMP